MLITFFVQFRLCEPIFFFCQRFIVFSQTILFHLSFIALRLGRLEIGLLWTVQLIFYFIHKNISLPDVFLEAGCRAADRICRHMANACSQTKRKQGFGGQLVQALFYSWFQWKSSLLITIRHDNEKFIATIANRHPIFFKAIRYSSRYNFDRDIALIVAIFLAVPYLKSRYLTGARKKGGAAHA